MARPACQSDDTFSLLALPVRVQQYNARQDANCPRSGTETALGRCRVA
jgi:hypothetical protein